MAIMLYGNLNFRRTTLKDNGNQLDLVQ